MADIEIWRDIEGFEGYQVSSFGRVRSLPKGGKGIGKGCYRTGTILNGELSKDGQGKIRYMIYKDQKPKRFMGHVLVAKAFHEICGDWFEGCQVHHKDGNPSNNKADNLICLTEKEHRDIHVKLGYRKGEHNYWYGKKIPKEVIRKQVKKKRKPIIQMDLQGNELVYWFSVTDCERETGMDKAAINRVCLGKQHTSYGYRWCYASSSD